LHQSYLKADSDVGVNSSAPVEFDLFAEILGFDAVFLAFSAFDADVEEIFSVFPAEASQEHSVLDELGDGGFVDGEEVNPPSAVLPVSFLGSLGVEEHVVVRI
jgi:hypothetical protein